MQYLTDENGLLVINHERIDAVIAAKTEELALNQALTYVERLRLATEENSVENLDELLYATQATTSSTWGLVYAQLALLKTEGKLNEGQYQAALSNIKSLQAIAKSAISSVGRVAGESADELERMKSGTDDLLKHVMEMLKHRIQEQIDALNEMKKAYQEIINLRKEALDDAKKEADYQDEVAKKIREIAKLQARINALSLDDSRDAKAQRASLEEQMYELQKDLSDKQADYARDAQKDALDDMQEAYEKEKDEEIKVLENSISSYQKLYDMAISYISDHWDTLYQELIGWNTEYGSVLNSEITTAWENALAAAQRYGDYVSALSQLPADIATAETGGTSHHDILGPSDVDTSFTNRDSVKAIVAQMRQLSTQWSKTNSKERNDELHRQAADKAALLKQYGVKADFDGSTGTWRIIEDLLDPSNVGKLLYNVYHTGGIAGGNGTPKQNEILALLEKGEAILDERKERGLYRLVDFVTNMSDKFDKLIATSGIDRVFSGTRGDTPQVGDIAPVTKNEGNTVEFGDVYIYGANDDTVEKHREINRRFMNEAIRQLNIKR